MAIGFGSYNIAKSGLYVNERALDVTGHNITNMNTPGYVRQQAMIKNAPYQTVSNNGNQLQQLGLGADLQQIRQIRNSFLDIMYRNENMTQGYWEAKYKSVQDIESILVDPMKDGLQNVMNQFWDSWQELSKEPESLTVRAIVRQRGETLVNTINHMGSQLDKLVNDLSSEINVRINEVNKITSQIAKLNGVIYSQEASGGTANDYRDQRNILADKLTRLVNADITETQEGQLFVTVGGYSIVNQIKSTNLYIEKSNQGKLSHTPMIEGSGIKAPINNGLIKGLMDSVEEVEKVKDTLNTLVSAMAQEVNQLHKSGKTAGEFPMDGEDFFVQAKSGSPLGMSNIKLNGNLKDLNNIVVSTLESSGDNTVALEIAALRNKPKINDKTGVLSMDEYYQAIILKVGQSGNEAFNILQNQTKLVQAADAKRQSLSSVSLDEEMSNMMKYKFAYDASSRAFNAIDEIIDTLINRMGIVGR